jgi:hypothetical protein
MATPWTLGCDAADPHGMAAFWAVALGYVPEPGYEAEHLGHMVMLDPEGNKFGVA